MPRDFTLSVFKSLLETFLEAGYRILPFRTWMEETSPAGFDLTADGKQPQPNGRILILRHDIDKAPKKALQVAGLEYELGIKGTFYFKIDRGIFIREIIEEIAGMGHEIGYHYEDLVRARGDSHLAIREFNRNLELFREICPVVTICAEGSPLSKFDNRDLWKDYHYKDFGLIGEPYFDLDYQRFLYLTDTGRIWNGMAFNIRDKVDSKFVYQYKHSHDILEDLKAKKLEECIHLVTHPQRYHDAFLPWGYELLWQYLKNTVKRCIVKRQKSTVNP